MVGGFKIYLLCRIFDYTFINKLHNIYVFNYINLLLKIHHFKIQTLQEIFLIPAIGNIM